MVNDLFSLGFAVVSPFRRGAFFYSLLCTMTTDFSLPQMRVTLLFLGGGQPADQEQIFGVGCANDAVLASQLQCCQGTECQMSECYGGV